MSFWRENLNSLKNSECKTFVNFKEIKMRIAEINAPLIDLMELKEKTNKDIETFERKIKDK